VLHGKWPFEEKPLLVFWETTKACLLACKHCRAKAILEPLPGELSTEESYKLLEDIVGFGRPFPILVLTGGDPLMRKDLWEILSYARDLGIKTAIAPSVTPLLTKETVIKLKEYGVEAASVILDSPFPDVHDSIRGVEGTWHRTLDALKWFQSVGMRVQVNTTIMRDTVEGLADMVKLLLDNNIKVWEVFYLVPTGRAGKELDLTPEEWEDVTHFLYEASKYGLLVRTTEGPMFRRVALIRSYYEKRGELEKIDRERGSLYHRLLKRLRALLGEPRGIARAHTVGTMDGRGIVFVSYNGNVYPSGFLPISAGNIRLKSLVEIYRRSQLFNKLRNNIKGKCGKCEFKSICGGSRARAYAYTGNPYAEDPSCIYQPGSLPSSVLSQIFVRYSENREVS
jgi:radical SAM protein